MLLLDKENFLCWESKGDFENYFQKSRNAEDSHQEYNDMNGIA